MKRDAPILLLLLSHLYLGQSISCSLFANVQTNDAGDLMNKIKSVQKVLKDEELIKLRRGFNLPKAVISKSFSF